MKKGVLIALLLIALTALLLVFNSRSGMGWSKIELHLLFTTVNLIKSVAFFIFTAVGVVIGLLLK